MPLKSVRLYNFRNLRNCTIDTAASQVFLIGENGQGKTNFVEALYMLSFGGSFRTRRDRELVRLGESEMSCFGLYDTGELSHDIKIQYQNGAKSIFIDDRVLNDRRDMISQMPSVVFQHSDMGYVNGPPEQQRLFLDQTLSLDSPTYLDDLRRYRKILKSRNAAIKEGTVELLPVLNQQLIDTGLVVQTKRSEALDVFNQVFRDLFQSIAALPEVLQIEYRPSWRLSKKDQGKMSQADMRDAVSRTVLSKRDQELSLGTTLSGPHRDRIVYRYGDVDFTQIASTGQTRLVALILRLAQSRFYHQRTGRKPILLLDDVLLELDVARRERFVQALPESEQRVFTFLPNEPWNAYRTDGTLVLKVSDGSIQ